VSAGWSCVGHRGVARRLSACDRTGRLPEEPRSQPKAKPAAESVTAGGRKGDDETKTQRKKTWPTGLWDGRAGARPAPTGCNPRV